MENNPIVLKNSLARNSDLNYSDMSDSKVTGIKFRGTVFEDCDFSECSFHNIAFGKTIITHACFCGSEIPHGNIGDLKIAGIRVDDLLDAYKQVHGELPDPGHP